MAQANAGSNPVGTTMNLKDFYRVLARNENKALHIMLPSGEMVPAHFHVTEIGKVTKQFIDCGGTKRELTSCVLQVWVANDVDHRLKSTKLVSIMNMAESMLGSPWEMPVEIEYGSECISQYPVGDVEVTPNGLLMILGAKKTECLAPDKCGVSGCC